MTTPTSTPGTIAASYFAARPNDGATYDAAADFRALMARCDDLQTQLDATTVAGDRILRQWKAASERGHAKLAESEAHAERLATALRNAARRMDEVRYGILDREPWSQDTIAAYAANLLEATNQADAALKATK